MINSHRSFGAILDPAHSKGERLVSFAMGIVALPSLHINFCPLGFTRVISTFDQLTNSTRGRIITTLRTNNEPRRGQTAFCGVAESRTSNAYCTHLKGML